MRVRIAVGAALVLCAALGHAADQAWDAREARGIREVVYPAIEHLSDFAQIKATFEKAIANDSNAAPALAALVTHANEDVASTAAQTLGRFAGETASTVLKDAYATDSRVIVRINALGGLARMKDPATGPLAVAALGNESELLQGGRLGALEALDDPACSSAILQYLDAHPREITQGVLKALGELGDPSGSTAVRDRLLSEANKKTNDFDFRYSAALGLRSMELADLVKPIFDIIKAKNTNSSLIVVRSAIVRLAAVRGITVKGQTEVDPLLRDVDISARRKRDEWGRSLRARFVSDGIFQVVSDGPDMTPDTVDDLSTAEPLHVYNRRVFPDQFIQP